MARPTRVVPLAIAPTPQRQREAGAQLKCAIAGRRVMVISERYEVEMVDGRPGWAPEQIDLDRPSISRVYDYLLGGAHNFQADRDLAEQVLGLDHQARRDARANRAVLHRE